MSGALTTSVGFAATGGVSVFAGAVLATRLDLQAGARSLVLGLAGMLLIRPHTA